MLRNVLPRYLLPAQPTSVLRVPLAALPAIVNTATRFVLGSVGWDQNDVTSAGGLTLVVPGIPQRCKLLQATFHIDPVPHVGLPATPPSFRVFNYVDHSLTQLGVTVVDPSATIAAYGAAHDVVIPNLNFDVTPTGTGWIQVAIAGETGANSLIGLDLNWVEFLIGR